jgi:hypothetical protein
MFILFALPGLLRQLEFSRFRGCNASKSNGLAMPKARARIDGIAAFQLPPHLAMA